MHQVTHGSSIVVLPAWRILQNTRCQPTLTLHASQCRIPVTRSQCGTGQHNTETCALQSKSEKVAKCCCHAQLGLPMTDTLGKHWALMQMLHASWPVQCMCLTCHSSTTSRQGITCTVYLTGRAPRVLALSLSCGRSNLTCISAQQD